MTPDREKRDQAFSVLLVEDDSAHGKLMFGALGQLGRVAWARTLAEAEELVSNERFDVFVLDQHLADGLGTQFREWACERAAGGAPPTVFVSSDDQVAAQTCELAATRFVSKSPGYLENLLGEVRALT